MYMQAAASVTQDGLEHISKLNMVMASLQEPQAW